MLDTDPDADLRRDRPVADSARHDVRAAGRADRRIVHRPAALQRLFARLSAGLGDRGRTGAADRDWLFGQYGTGYAVAAYIAICAAVSLIATALMTDYTGKDIETD